jgi:PHP family Zn ribbon phosphoesterase
VKVLEVLLSQVYTDQEIKSLARIQKNLGLRPLSESRKYKIYPCPNCSGTLRPIGEKAFAVVCQCNKCGKRYRR